MPNAAPDVASVSLEQSAEAQLLMYLRGNWLSQHPMPKPRLRDLHRSLSNAQHLSFNTEGLRQWDSALVVFLHQLLAAAQAQGLEVDLTGLPPGVQRLLSLAARSPERFDTIRPQVPDGPLRRLGVLGLAVWRDMRGSLHFVGESALAVARIVKREARFNFEDLWPLMQDCGPRALPIITLVSFLVGTILAYMGAVQLQQFGAQIFIADLVGLGMAREMGAIMTGVVVAGRSGAAFAAQLGTMQANEEIDAIRTMGISPFDYLVLPRLVALILMVPLLTLYAIFMGIVGGMVVAISLMELHVLQYLNQTIAALSIADLAAGLIKSTVYGTLIALAGCMRGMQCGKSAEAVGLATTSAVVTSIVYMVIAAALLAVVFHETGL